jgi:hypothetical protein
MNYPLISEYVEAIKAAEDNFDQLKHLHPVLDDEGQPVMSSGNFAVVFKMKDEQTGKLHAVKCFLKEQEGRAEAYRQIAEELEFVSSTFLTPIKYLDKELFVDTGNSDESEFPVLLMDWVEGQTLDKYIREHIDDQYELSLLAYQFSRLAMWLLPQAFAHGDLKPDNILVKDDGTLVLVDYDGMYVPAMKGQKARELGSPDFRHPSRTEDVFDEHIDDFSLVSILLSLKTIALQPDLLEQYGASDRLLFSEKDYRNLSESQVMDALKTMMQDTELATLFSLFILSSAQNNLSQTSFRLLNLSRPDKSKYEKEDLSTEINEEEYEYDNCWHDEFNVEYSKDRSRLLDASIIETDVYSILEGTKIVCNKAFEGCRLESIHLPNSLIKIGDDSFAGGELSPVILPASLLEIGNYAFGESTISAISLNEGLKKIGDNAFCLCNLISITIPHSVKEIGDQVFYGCKKLVSITILNRNIKIGKDVFLDCANLKSICVPCGSKSRFVTLFPELAEIIDEDRNDDISECDDPVMLNTLVTKEDLEEAWIGEYGVKYSADRKRLLNAKSDIKDFKVRTGTKVICNKAFGWNPLYHTHGYALSSIKLPDGLLSIGVESFFGSDLKSIEIPKTVKNIGERAFAYCKHLSSITVDSQNIFFDSRNKCNAIIDSQYNTLIAGCSNTIIPKDIKAIGDSAFSGFDTIVSVIVPNGVKEIGNNAFHGCHGMSSIVIPDSVTTIGKSAFNGCRELTKIHLSNEIVKIEDGTFAGCKSLLSIIIPQSVCSIGDDAFIYCKKLSSVNIPESVTWIGFNAFEWCESLASVSIPNGITKIANSTFRGCKSLTNVKIPNSVTEIWDFAFSDCTNLETIILSEKIAKIGNHAFNGCTNLQSISLPDSLETVGQRIFDNCKNLESIIIPKGTKEKFVKLLPSYKDKLVEKVNKQTINFDNSNVSAVERCRVYKDSNRWIVKIDFKTEEKIDGLLSLLAGSQDIKLDDQSIQKLELFGLTLSEGFYINPKAISVTHEPPTTYKAKILFDTDYLEISGITWGLNNNINQWQIKTVRSFNIEERLAVNRAEVVPSDYGNSVCFFMVSGGQTYIPLSKQSKLTVGDELDLRTAKLITLCCKGEKDIVRVLE